MGSLYCDSTVQLYVPTRPAVWVASKNGRGKREPYSLVSFARSLSDGFSRSSSHYRISWPALRHKGAIIGSHATVVGSNPTRVWFQDLQAYRTLLRAYGCAREHVEMSSEESVTLFFMTDSGLIKDWNPRMSGLVARLMEVGRDESVMSLFLTLQRLVVRSLEVFSSVSRSRNHFRLILFGAIDLPRAAARSFTRPHEDVFEIFWPGGSSPSL